MKNTHAESGNVLFYILIAVALLAALSFAVTQGGRGGTKAISEENARLFATEILEYSNNVASAVAQTRLRGFSDTEISFENNVVGVYTNSNCTEALCEIFNIGGGGITYNPPSAELLDSSFSADTSFGEWIFSGANTAPRIGSDCTGASCKELLILLPYIDREICIALNNQTGVNNPGGNPPVEGAGISVGKFIGAYGTGAGGIDAAADLVGQRSACFQVTASPANDAHIFMRVLIAR